jgi:uncharacterized protein
MYFVVFASDKPGHERVRAQIRSAHRQYLRNPGAHCVVIHFGGPTLTTDGQQMNGTLLVVEAQRIEDVVAFVDDDPYARAELFESVVVRPWEWGLGAPVAHGS